MTSNIKIKTFRINGMKCVSCELEIESKLQDVAGVLNVKADFVKQEIMVEYDIEIISLYEIEEIIGELGFSNQASDSGARKLNIISIIALGIAIFSFYIIFTSFQGQSKRNVSAGSGNDNNQPGESVIQDVNSQEEDGLSDDEYGSDSFDNLIKITIPTDEIAVAEIVDGMQYITINIDDNGFSPAVIILQEEIETEWNINQTEADISYDSLLFPLYYAQIQLEEGENIIRFIPELDFDFFSEGGLFYGYVKVVEDINDIDIEAIAKEVDEYNPAEAWYNNSWGGGDGAACH